MAARKARVSVESNGSMPAILKAGDSVEVLSKNLSVRIPREMDFRLSSIARSEGETKAELAVRLLDQGLQRFGLDEELRSLWVTIRRKAGEAA